MANGISRFNLPTDLNVSGGVGVTVTGSVYVQNAVSASSFTGSGAAITDITASNIPNFTSDVRRQFVAGPGITIQSGTISASFANYELTGTATPGTNAYNIVIENGNTSHPSASLSANISLTSVSASFSGSGANLHSIPAEAINGLNLDRITIGNVTASVINSVSASEAAFQISKNTVPLFTITNSGSIFTKDAKIAHGGATGSYSVAIGEGRAIGNYSHAEGRDTTASGQYSHAEGYATTASGNYSHAEGSDSNAVGEASHAEGNFTTALGQYSHAEGSNTVSSGTYSHAQGIGTIASGSGQAVLGKFNTRGNTDSLVVIGNGTADNDRKDLFIVNTDGIIVSGTIQSTVGFTGSLAGTASYANNADHLDGYDAGAFPRLAITNIFSANQVITGNLDITGRLSAHELFVQYESSSIIFSSGSTQFGNSYDDVHRFTGSIFVTGGIHTQGDLTVQEAIISDSIAVQLSGSENKTILSYSTNYVSSKLIITGESLDENDNNQTMEILVLRNGDSLSPTVTWVPYALLHTSTTPVFSISAQIGGGLITINALNLTNEDIKIRTQKIYSLNAAG